MTRPVSLEYLSRQLKMDPRTSASRIIALRNKQLGVMARGGPESTQRLQTPQEVASARSAIESIRKQFWSLPLEALNQQLAEIDVRPYPELATVVDQLKQAAAIRADFPKLAQRLDGDLGLFHCVKQAVTMPPRDVAGMKETVMRRLLAGEDVKSYKAAAKIIKQEFPSIYGLQREWFDDIIKAKRLSRDTFALNQDFKLGAPTWIYVILFILLWRGCMSMMQ